jgi:hypothetical protein
MVTFNSVTQHKAMLFVLCIIPALKYRENHCFISSNYFFLHIFRLFQVFSVILSSYSAKSTKHISKNEALCSTCEWKCEKLLLDARTVITVRAYSVDWLLHLHLRALLTASIRRRGISSTLPNIKCP